jgi:hypothetical protein
MREDDLRGGELLREGEGVLAEGRNAATGVDQHRNPALVRNREDAPYGRFVEREAVGAGMELDPTRAVVETTLGFAHRIVAGVEPAERDEPAVGRGGLGEDAVVGRVVAVGLVHREDDGAGADRVQRRDQLARRAGKAVRVARARVRVRVEEHEVRDFGLRRGQQTGEHLGGAHRSKHTCG